MKPIDQHKLLNVIHSIDKHLSGIHTALDELAAKNQSDGREKTLLAELSVPAVITQYYYAKQNESPSIWQKLKFPVQIASVVVAAILALLNLLVLIEIRRQTPLIRKSADAAKTSAYAAKLDADLTRRTAAAVSAATCHLSINHRSLQHMSFTVHCDPGRLDASLQRAELRVSVRRLPSGQTVGSDQTFVLPKQMIRPGHDSEPPVDFDINSLSEQDFYSLREEVVISGSIDYSDGFDRIIPATFCETVLPFPNLNAAGKLNGMANPNCGGPTDDLLRQLRALDTSKK